MDMCDIRISIYQYYTVTVNLLTHFFLKFIKFAGFSAWKFTWKKPVFLIGIFRYSFSKEPC